MGLLVHRKIPELRVRIVLSYQLCQCLGGHDATGDDLDLLIGVVGDRRLDEILWDRGRLENDGRRRA
ncbi:MAG TPA: hypothetical protein VIY90_14210, partial [Steroidobacteraceae bacterium]